MRTTSRIISRGGDAEAGSERVFSRFRYCVTVPGGGQRMDVRTIPDLLRHAIETHRKPDAFLVKRDGRWEPVSIEDFASRVRAVEADLVARGVKHGDRVAILSEN